MKKIITIFLFLWLQGCCSSRKCDPCLPLYFKIGFSNDSIQGLTDEEIKSMYRVYDLSNDTIKFTDGITYLSSNYSNSTFKIISLRNDSINFKINKIYPTMKATKSKGCCHCSEIEYVDVNINDRTRRIRENETYILSRNDL